MDNLRDFLGIRRIDSPECRDKGVVRSDEGILWSFNHVDRMENDRFTKRVYIE